MRIARIPLKNIVVDFEQKYLEKKAQKGWILSKKGMFLYYFARQKTDKKYYSIDRIPADMTEDFATYLNEDFLTKGSGLKKKLVRAYYLHEEPVEDSKQEYLSRVSAYKKNAEYWTNVVVISGFPIALAFGMATAGCSIDTPLYISLIVLLAVINLLGFYLNFQLINAYKTILAKLGMKDEDDRAHFVILFDELPENHQKLLTQELQAYGDMEISNKIVRISSAYKKEELKAAISEILDLEPERFKVMHVGDMYFM
jgi:hypothetical protein